MATPTERHVEGGGHPTGPPPETGENLVARVEEARRVMESYDQSEVIAWLLDAKLDDIRKVMGLLPADPAPVPSTVYSALLTVAYVATELVVDVTDPHWTPLIRALDAWENAKR